MRRRHGEKTISTRSTFDWPRRSSTFPFPWAIFPLYSLYYIFVNLYFYVYHLIWTIVKALEEFRVSAAIFEFPFVVVSPRLAHSFYSHLLFHFTFSIPFIGDKYQLRISNEWFCEVLRFRWSIDPQRTRSHRRRRLSRTRTRQRLPIRKWEQGEQPKQRQRMSFSLGWRRPTMMSARLATPTPSSSVLPSASSWEWILSVLAIFILILILSIFSFNMKLILSHLSRSDGFQGADEAGARGDGAASRFWCHPWRLRHPHRQCHRPLAWYSSNFSTFVSSIFVS